MAKAVAACGVLLLMLALIRVRNMRVDQMSFLAYLVRIDEAMP
jgi:hypothetical protein